MPSLALSPNKKKQVKAQKIIELDLQSVGSHSQMSAVQRNRGIVQDSERDATSEHNKDFSSNNRFMPRDDSNANLEAVKSAKNGTNEQDSVENDDYNEDGDRFEVNSNGQINFAGLKR